MRYRTEYHQTLKYPLSKTQKQRLIAKTFSKHIKLNRRESKYMCWRSAARFGLFWLTYVVPDAAPSGTAVT